jgi:hypothetical protein
MTSQKWIACMLLLITTAQAYNLFGGWPSCCDSNITPNKVKPLCTYNNRTHTIITSARTLMNNKWSNQQSVTIQGTTIILQDTYSKCMGRNLIQLTNSATNHSEVILYTELIKPYKDIQSKVSKKLDHLLKPKIKILRTDSQEIRRIVILGEDENKLLRSKSRMNLKEKEKEKYNFNL